MAGDLNAQKGTYVAAEWKDDISDFTPITADRLNHIEQGIQANSQDIKSLGDSWDSASSNLIKLVEVRFTYSCPANGATGVLTTTLPIHEGFHPAFVGGVQPSHGSAMLTRFQVAGNTLYFEARSTGGITNMTCLIIVVYLRNNI